MHEVRVTDIGTLCEGRRWPRTRLVHELRQAARPRNVRLPGDESLERMIRQWNAGDRGLSPLYAELLTAVFGVPFSREKVNHSILDTTENDPSALSERLQSAASVDRELVLLLEDQTESYRGLDRRLGARKMLGQTEGHVANIQDLLTYSLPGSHRASLAAAAAEAAALAGWQALDLGNTEKAWKLHEAAKSAARESGNPAILAHVTAQQGYALLDVDRAEDALSLMQYARIEATGKVPALLSAWLWAAEAEAEAAGGNDPAARRALDSAAENLTSEEGETLPYLFLDEVHLSRWRGNCLARLGAVEAIDDLTTALDRLDPTFTRAAAGLHCDLALALSVRGQTVEAQVEARKADTLARQTASTRQRLRIKRLLSGDSERPGR